MPDPYAGFWHFPPDRSTRPRLPCLPTEPPEHYDMDGKEELRAEWLAEKRELDLWDEESRGP